MFCVGIVSLGLIGTRNVSGSKLCLWRLTRTARFRASGQSLSQHMDAITCSESVDNFSADLPFSFAMTIAHPLTTTDPIADSHSLLRLIC